MPTCSFGIVPPFRGRDYSLAYQLLTSKVNAATAPRNKMASRWLRNLSSVPRLLPGTSQIRTCCRPSGFALLSLLPASLQPPHSALLPLRTAAAVRPQSLSSEPLVVLTLCSEHGGKKSPWLGTMARKLRTRQLAPPQHCSRGGTAALSSGQRPWQSFARPSRQQTVW